MPTESQIREALKAVIDPELRRDIVELEMVRSIAVKDGGVVDVTVSLTTPGCPIKGHFQTDVTKAVTGVEGVTHCNVGFDVLSDQEKGVLQRKLGRPGGLPEGSLNRAKLKPPPPLTPIEEYVQAVDADAEKLAVAIDSIKAYAKFWTDVFDAAETEDGSVVASEALYRFVRDHIDYLSGATNVKTNAMQAWSKGQGVCQDIAHITVGALRCAGIPARYVSGYFDPRQDPQPGEVASAQSHAWVEWWDGGWNGFDPTTSVQIGTRHVTLGRGRDYADVPPFKGLFSGSKSEGHTVTVEVTRLA